MGIYIKPLSSVSLSRSLDHMKSSRALLFYQSAFEGMFGLGGLEYIYPLFLALQLDIDGGGKNTNYVGIRWGARFVIILKFVIEFGFVGILLLRVIITLFPIFLVLGF